MTVRHPIKAIIDAQSGTGWAELSDGSYKFIREEETLHVDVYRKNCSFEDKAKSLVLMSRNNVSGHVVVSEFSSYGCSSCKVSMNSGVVGEVLPTSYVHGSDRLAFFGEKLLSRKFVSQICRQYPNSTIFFSPYAVGFGTLSSMTNSLIGIDGIDLFSDFRETEESFIGHVEFDECIPFDAEGNMAMAASKGAICVNQISSYHSSSNIWFGRALGNNINSDSISFIVKKEFIKEYFPRILNSEICAAETIGVAMENSAYFKELSGCNSNYVVIMTTGVIGSISNFMSFHHRFSNKNFIQTHSVDCLKNDITACMFRRNRMYRMKVSEVIKCPTLF